MAAANNKKSLIGISILVAILACVSGYWIWNKSSTSTANEIKEITVAQWGQEKYLIYLPLYVAMEKGYFEEEGLSVSLAYTGNDDQTFAAVLSGSAQFGIGDPAFAAISNEKGLGAKVVATIVGGVAIWGVTNNDSVPNIENYNDLAGLRVGTFPSPSTNYTLMRALLNEHSDSLADTTIVEAGIGAQLALLESDAADIAMVLEPAASVAESEGYRVVYSSPKFHGPFAFTGVTTTDEYISSNSDTVEKFVRALQRAVEASHQDPSIAFEVGAKLFPNLDSRVVENAVNRMIFEKTFPDNAVVSDAAWGSLIDVRTAVGDLDSEQPMSTSVDNSFALKAQDP